MWVKICGNTNLEDACLAAELGADAVGFVFAPSKRQVTPDEVARMTPHLPRHVERIGVFPAWPAEKIIAAAHLAGLTSIQLHGEFDPVLVQLLKKRLPPEIAIIQAIHWAIDQEGSATDALSRKLLQIQASSAVDHILVDSKVGFATGGTGLPFDWDAAQSLLASHPGMILAGGLQAQNVREAIEKLSPWGVDVASGVEAVTGKKDPEKLALFLREAKRSTAA